MKTLPGFGGSVAGNESLEGKILDHFSQEILGFPKPGCFKRGCLQFSRGSALLRPFCALLHSFADLRLRSFALSCVFLRPTTLKRPRLGTAEDFVTQQKYFVPTSICRCATLTYRAILVAIVSHNSFVLASWGIAQLSRGYVS